MFSILRILLGPAKKTLAGKFSHSDFQKMIMLLIVTLGGGTLLNVGMDEISHYWDIAKPEAEGQEITLTIVLIAVEFLRRKAHGSNNDIVIGTKTPSKPKRPMPKIPGTK